MEILEEKKNKNKPYKPILEDIPDWPVYQLSKNRKEFIEEVTQQSITRIKALRPQRKQLIDDLEATVYWSASKNATYLAIRNLPEPPADKQYQLWAIVDKKPVDAGVFEYNLSEIQSMKVFEEAQAFAVTLEPEGGSKSPTLEKMYVLGTL